MDDNGTPVEAMEDARVVISELVANAVRHARPLSDGQIHVSLDARAAGAPALRHRRWQRHPPARAARLLVRALAGRGMAIVEVLPRSGGPSRARARTTVHALLNV